MSAGQQLGFELGPAGGAIVAPAGERAARRPRRAHGGGGGIQVQLGLGDPPRTARHRPASVQREAEAIYHAVETLRGAGHRVYRAGALHRVDDRQLTTAQLMRLARAERRREGGSR